MFGPTYPYAQFGYTVGGSGTSSSYPSYQGYSSYYR
jgi:hypothetical protein